MYTYLFHCHGLREKEKKSERWSGGKRKERRREGERGRGKEGKSAISV